MTIARSMSYFFVLQFAVLCQLYHFSDAEPLYGDLHSAIAPVDNHRLSFTALIVNKDKANTIGYHVCTGTLVTQNKVLTAASCLEGISVKSLEVVFGTTNDMSKKHQRFKVESKYTFEDWCKNNPCFFFDKYTDDLCVLKLRAIDVGILPAILATFATTNKNPLKNLAYPLPGTVVKMIGWGHTRDDYFPKLPHKSHAVLLSKPQCEQRVKKLIPACLSDAVLPERVLCAADQPPVLAVRGDFGGPVIYEKDRSVSAIIIQRCPMYHPLDINAEQVNLLLHLGYYKNYLLDALQP